MRQFAASTSKAILDAPRNFNQRRKNRNKKKKKDKEDETPTMVPSTHGSIPPKEDEKRPSTTAPKSSPTGSQEITPSQSVPPKAANVSPEILDITGDVAALTVEEEPGDVAIQQASTSESATSSGTLVEPEDSSSFESVPSKTESGDASDVPQDSTKHGDVTPSGDVTPAQAKDQGSTHDSTRRRVGKCHECRVVTDVKSAVRDCFGHRHVPPARSLRTAARRPATGRGSTTAAPRFAQLIVAPIAAA